MLPDDTIAAISTAPGEGAIAVVRLSGSAAFAIAGQLFSGHGTLESHRARHGFLKDPETGSVVDEVVMTAFAGPRSYTGEDMIEISCHGSPVVAREILRLCLSQGARLAQAGEFTRRAFTCGRMDLTQAEAVLDLIQAKTARQGRMAMSALSGDLGAEIRRLRQSIMSVLAAVVAGIDFPEEVGEAPVADVRATVEQARARLDDLAATSLSGRYLREGLRLSIVGRPNAGKSSLLNRLLNFERAIVTDIPGTTRDALEELIEINGIPVILIDTAGVRPTEDRVELIGIERTGQAIARADLVVLLVDLTQGWGPAEDELARLAAGKPVIVAGNKIDIAERKEAGACALAGVVDQLFLSAVTGEGIACLKAAVERFVFGQGKLADCRPSLNARQAEILSRASRSLSLVEEALASGLPQDCLATDLKNCVDSLSEVCGEAVSEEVIEQVFARFCIGK